jgi:nucleoside-diphosphate-sugar epimerase
VREFTRAHRPVAAGLCRGAMPCHTGNGQADKVLITGGCGFIGTNLADRLLTAGREVVLLDNLSRSHVQRNLDWLTTRHGRLLRVGDR